MPRWLYDIIKPPAAEVLREATTSSAKYYAGAGTVALKGLARTVANAAIGERNNILNWAAYRAREHVAQGDVTAAFVSEVLIEAASRCGLDRTEAAKTVNSGLGGKRCHD